MIAKRIAIAEYLEIDFAAESWYCRSRLGIGASAGFKSTAPLMRTLGSRDGLTRSARDIRVP